MSGALIEAASVLQRPFPVESISRMRKLERTKFLGAIEDLEVRLVLACAMRKNVWINSEAMGPKLNPESNEPLDIASIVRSQHLIEQDIVAHISKPGVERFVFPLRKILLQMLNTKILLCEDYGLRVLMQHVEHSLRTDSGEVEELDVAGISGKDDVRRRWFRLIGIYQSILGLIKVNSPVVESMKLELSWIKDDQTLLPMLYAYAILHGQVGRIESLNKFATTLHATHPDCVTLYEAMSAYA